MWNIVIFFYKTFMGIEVEKDYVVTLTIFLMKEWEFSIQMYCYICLKVLLLRVVQVNVFLLQEVLLFWLRPKAMTLWISTAVQQQKAFGVCFWEGYLLALEWDLVHLLQLFMWLRYMFKWWYHQILHYEITLYCILKIFLTFFSCQILLQL